MKRSSKIIKLLCMTLCLVFVFTCTSFGAIALSPSTTGSSNGDGKDGLLSPTDTYTVYKPDTDDYFDIDIPASGELGKDIVITLQVYIEGSGLNDCGYSDVRFTSVENIIIDDAMPTEKWNKITTQTKLLFDGVSSFVRIRLLNGEGETIRIKDSVKTSSAVLSESMLCGATLYMLPCVEMEQNCSFVVYTRGKTLLVFDGGNEGDAEYLVDFLYTLKSEVDHWFISHLHGDHIGALSVVLRENLIHVKNLYHDLPSAADCDKNEGTSVWYSDLTEYVKSDYNVVENFIRMKKDEVIEIDDNVKITVLNEMMQYSNNWGNNTNVCLRMDTFDGEKQGESVLFTGDSGIEVGDWLLENNPGGIKDCAIVTAAHHGQNGTSKAFYEVVAADMWLVPAPTWLWYGASAKGTYFIDNSFDTANVRSWIRDLEVARTYIAKDGIVAIR